MDVLNKKPVVDFKNRLPRYGDVVDVWWDDRSTTYRGRLGETCEPVSPTSKSRRPRKRFRYTVFYDDGDVFVHDLNRMKWRFVNSESNKCGNWIRPGDVEQRALRALKAAVYDTSPKKSEATNFVQASELNQTHRNADLIFHKRRNSSNQGTLALEPADVAAKQDGKRRKEQKGFNRVEKSVSEALLMLSDNAHVGSL